MSKRKKIGKIFWVIVTLIPILAMIWGIVSPKNFEQARVVWHTRIMWFGIFGPIVFVLLQAVQVIITPMSHYTVGVIGGFLYGPWYGALLNYIGRLIGHITAFFLGRKYGRKLIKRFVDEDVIKKYDHYVSGERDFSPQVMILFLMYFLPLFPDDELSYLVGFSRMKFKSFLLANMFGHTCGSLSLAYIGSGINTKDMLFWILFIVNLLGFPIIWYLMRLVKKSAKKV